MNKNFDDILLESQVMSAHKDIDMAASILDFFKPSHVLELGTGGGGWIITMNVLLGNDHIKWYGYDNFEFDYGLDWPKNPAELKNRILEKSKKLGATGDNIVIRNEDITNLDVEFIRSLQIEFDIVRIDCLHENMEQVRDLLYAIMPFTSDKCVFLVDDIVPHIAINRLLGVMELVKEHKLKPFWFGLREGAWVKNQYDISNALNNIQNQKHKKYYQFEIQTIDLYGNDVRYIRTK